MANLTAAPLARAVVTQAVVTKAVVTPQDIMAAAAPTLTESHHRDSDVVMMPAVYDETIQILMAALPLLSLLWTLARMAYASCRHRLFAPVRTGGDVEDNSTSTAGAVGIPAAELSSSSSYSPLGANGELLSARASKFSDEQRERDRKEEEAIKKRAEDKALKNGT